MRGPSPIAAAAFWIVKVSSCRLLCGRADIFTVQNHWRRDSRLSVMCACVWILLAAAVRTSYFVCCWYLYNMINVTAHGCEIELLNGCASECVLRTGNAASMVMRSSTNESEIWSKMLFFHLFQCWHGSRKEKWSNFFLHCIIFCLHWTIMNYILSKVHKEMWFDIFHFLEYWLLTLCLYLDLMWTEWTFGICVLCCV